MITAEFDYKAPTDLDRLLDVLRREAENTKLLAGGMTLVPMLNLGLLSPDLLISLRNIPDLSGVIEQPDCIVVGAMTRHHVVASDPLVGRFAPLLSLSAGLIGDVQVRNRGTLGGSLAHADPAANYLPAVIALESYIELVGPSGRRAVPAKDFFRGVMTTELEKDELIMSVRIPKCTVLMGCGFRKFTRVKGNFPIVCAAALWDIEKGAGKLVIGGVTPTPTMLDVLSYEIAAQPLLGDIIRAAIKEPLEDQNGDAEYKREMAAVFGGRALTDARADGDAKKVAGR
jgi:aerobic carbon-monoxide dehydrogenase medium subunit